MISKQLYSNSMIVCEHYIIYMLFFRFLCGLFFYPGEIVSNLNIFDRSEKLSWPSCFNFRHSTTSGTVPLTWRSSSANCWEVFKNNPKNVTITHINITNEWKQSKDLAIWPSLYSECQNAITFASIMRQGHSSWYVLIYKWLSQKNYYS